MFYIIVLTSLEKLIEVEIWFKSLKFKHRGVGCGRAASLTVQEIFLFINHRQTLQTVPMLLSSLNRAGSLERLEQSQDERAEV